MTPKLRFPEFTDEWHVKRLCDISKVKGGKRIPKGYSLQTENNGMPYITVSDMKNGGVDTRNIKYVPSEAASQIKNYKISTNDIYISVAGTLGLVGTIPPELEGANLTENADKLTDIKISKSYLLQYLKSGKFKKLVKSTQTDNAQPKLAIYSIKSFEVGLSSKEEQEKIAEFLTVVNDRIDITQQKVELLKQYKKGVMQKIFTQQIRFKNKNGEDCLDWENTSVGELGVPYSGLSGKSGDDFGQGENFITYMQVYTDSADDAGKFGKVAILPNEKQEQVRHGDILFTISSETPQEVGLTSVVMSEIKEALYLNSFCFGLRVNAAKLLPGFAKFLFRSHDVRSRVMKLAQGSTRFNISKKAIMKMAIDIPEVNEQQKIADFLTAMDDRIKAEEAKLAAAKKFKKSLLQRMLV